MQVLQILLLLAVAITVVPRTARAQELSSYPFSATLRQDEDGTSVYSLYWSFDSAAETISFAVRVRTTGWVGFGLSPDGGMTGSDVVIGWVGDDGVANLDDRFAEGQSLPPVDTSQDWFLIDGSESDGYTVLRFTRDWVTCDNKDRDIEANTARVVFSWNPNDPADKDSPTYHGTERRGSTSLNLLGGLVDPPELPDDLDSFSIRVSNVVIPNNTDTTYWCAAIEIPEDIQNEGAYIVKTSPAISDNGFQYVHHLILTQCYDERDPATIGPDKGSLCDDIGNGNVAMCQNGIGLGGWAVGGEDFVLPAGVGIPVGGVGYPTYTILELHYDNPLLTPGVVDSSGMMLFYTRTNPGSEAGDFIVGHDVSPFLVIPPNMESFTVLSVCTSKCTSKNVQSEGVKVFGNNLHTHLAGRGVELTHIRRNKQCNLEEELKPIEANLQYDFNYQQTTHLPEEIELLPGDVLLLKCHYSTSDRDKATVGGESTREEMCLSYVYHYPRSDLYFCVSHVSTDTYFDFMINNLSEEELNKLGMINFSAPDILGAWTDFLTNEVTWTDAKKQALQDVYLEGPYDVYCDDDSNIEMPYSLEVNQPIPQVDCPYEAPDSCMPGFQPTPCCEGAAASTAFSILLLLLSAMAVLLLFLE